jgi:hypothetical protein
MVTTCWIIRTFQQHYRETAKAALQASGMVEEEEPESEEAAARARAAWENRWADCEDSDESPPPSDDGAVHPTSSPRDIPNEKDGH